MQGRGSEVPEVHHLIENKVDQVFGNKQGVKRP